MINKELPNAIEVEAELLGTLLQNEGAIHDCLHLITDECFYKDSHKDMWRAVIKIHKSGVDVNIVSVAQYLADQNQVDQFGGFAGIAEFTSQNFHSNVSGCARILHDKFIRRKTIISSYELIQKAYDSTNDIQSEITKSQNALSEVITEHIEATHTAQEVSYEIAREISDNLGKFQEVTGVPTGFESYDKRIGGLSDEGDLIIIAARPSMGKTTFALNIAQNAQKHFGYSGAFFSLEMSIKQLCRILMAMESGVSAKDLKKNKVNSIQLEHIFKNLENDPKETNLFIDDQSSQLSYIVSKIYKLKRDHDIKFVIIDYMQLMTCESKANREKEIEHISRTLKIVAKALSIPIIPLCQLSRAVETRGGSKVPILSDLRDSGSIEQDASVISFLMRPEYYGITEDEEGNSLVGVTGVYTKKNRFGELGVDYLFFDKELSEFQDFDQTTGYKKSVLDYDMGLVTMQDMNEDDNTFSFTEKMNGYEG